MLQLLRAEVIKITTTRTAAALIGGASAVAALGAFSTIASADPDALDGTVHEQDFFMLASINLALFALVVGIRVFTDEFRFGTIVPTLVVTPMRWRVLLAKIATAAVVGAVLAAVAQLAMLATAAIALAAKGANASFSRTDVAASVGLTVAAALWASIGVAVGALVRQQVGAIVGALIWVLLLENLGAGLLGDRGRFLPGQAGHGVAQASQAGALLDPAVAVLVLTAYAAAAAALAGVSLTRTDVLRG